MATIVPDRTTVGGTADAKGATVVTTTAISVERSQLKVNDVLDVGQSLISSNGRYSFVNQDDGNIVIYEKASNRPIWSSDTYRRGAAKLTLQADGNLKSSTWSTGTAGQGDASTVFSIQDSGNAVLLKQGRKIWQTGTSQIPRSKDDEKKPLEAGDILTADQALVSQNGRFRLVLQADSNLVLFDTSAGNSMLWTTENRGYREPKMTLGLDGNLVIKGGPFTTWESNTEGKGDSSSTLVVQDDGDVVIRAKDTTIWSTGTKLSAPVNADRLLAGENLRPGQFLMSPNGTYKLLLQAEGDLVLSDVKDDNRKVWSTNTGARSGRGIFRASLQADGNFVVYDKSSPQWSSRSASKDNSSLTPVLSVQNDGDLVIRSKDTQVWASGTKQKTDNLDRMVVGEDLVRGQSLKSPNGRYKFIMQEDGNVVLYDVKDGKKRELWSSGSRTYGTVKLSLQKDGNLVVYGSYSAEWSTETNGKGDESSILRIQDDGDVVLTSKGAKVWATGTIQREKTDYLNQGESLRADEALISPNKQFKLIMQADGNLVIYDVSKGEQSIWAARTNGSSPVRATLEDGGNFVVYTDGRCRWTSETRNCGTNLKVTIRDDGNVVLTASGSYVWSTRTGARQPVTGDRLTVGQSLGKDEALVSPNGRYKFIFQGDGNLVLYEGTNATWSSKTSWSATSVVVRDDDNLVITGPNWSSDTRRRVSGGTATLIMQDNGKVVLKSDGYIIWSTDSSQVNAPPAKYVAVSSGASQIKRGEYLAVNQSLVSPNGQWNAKLQSDGNFALRHRSSDVPLWTSGTAPNSAVTKLVMQYDCNCVMNGANDSAVWATGTNSMDANSSLILRDDGNMIVDSGRTWSTNVNFPALNGTIKELKRGQSLLQTQSLTSANGQYKLTFTDQGTICITKDGQSTYYYTCLGRSDAKYMTFGGEYYERPTIRIYNGKREELWSAGTRESQTGARNRAREKEYREGSEWAQRNGYDGRNAQRFEIPKYDEPRFTLGDDGNGYIWFENETIYSLFEAPKNGKGSSPNSPSCLRAGQELSTNQKLVSANDQWFAIMQPDCNFVVYPNNEWSKTAYWASRTERNGFSSSSNKVVMGYDGSLVVKDPWGNSIWSSPNKGSGDVYAVMEGDANLCTYANGKKLWGGRDQKW